MKNHPNAIIICIVLLISATLSFACASKRPYIVNDSQIRLELLATPYHEFTYVRLYPDNGELVIYGKVDHRHGWCEAEPHVDVAIVGSDKQIVRQTSLPIVKRGGKQHGWYGAAFRVRLPLLPEKGENIRLTFHEADCSKGEDFACGGNAGASIIEDADLENKSN